MKKGIVLASTVVLTGLALVGCGNNQSASNSTKSDNSSLNVKKSSEKQVKYSEQDYAMMAYLKLQGQTASELNQSKDNMNWNRDGNTYHIDFGAHTTSMTVIADSVEVTYDKPQDGVMGHDNGHKIYSKRQLAKEFGNQKKVIEEILSSATQKQSNSNQRNENGQTNSQGTAGNSATTENSSNVGQDKPLVKNGSTYRPKYNSNGQVDSWQVTDSDGITRTVGDPSPAWQNIESEYNEVNGR